MRNNDQLCTECQMVYTEASGDAEKLRRFYGNRCRCGGETMRESVGRSWLRFRSLVLALSGEPPEGMIAVACRAMFDDLLELGKNEGMNDALEIFSRRTAETFAAPADPSAIRADRPGPGTAANAAFEIVGAAPDFPCLCKNPYPAPPDENCPIHSCQCSDQGGYCPVHS